ncbi:MAG: PaaI family thioesterase [Rhizobiaceae bacterium]|nr:PaaI family thioesterase [Rhizobiaceae bacterium]
MRQWSVDEVKRRLQSFTANQGFNHWLSPRLLEADEHGAVLEASVREDMTQHHGFVHGGCVSALADMAAAWAGALASGLDVVTSNFSLHFVAPAVGEAIVARARVLRAGRSVVTVDVQVFSRSPDKDEKLCAAGITSIAVVSRPAPT